MNITRTEDADLLDACAKMMSETDPWITLQMNLQRCRMALVGDFKEVYVAMDADELIGFAALQMQGTFRGYIQTVCVSTQHQGKGIGTQLIRFSEARIFEASPNVFMCVSSFNTAAQRLYARLGFEKVGVLTDFIIRGHDELLLRKSIGAFSEYFAR